MKRSPNRRAPAPTIVAALRPSASERLAVNTGMVAVVAACAALAAVVMLAGRIFPDARL